MVSTTKHEKNVKKLRGWLGATKNRQVQGVHPTSVFVWLRLPVGAPRRARGRRDAGSTRVCAAGLGKLLPEQGSSKWWFPFILEQKAMFQMVAKCINLRSPAEP